MTKKTINKHVELSDFVDIEVEIDDFDDDDLIEELVDRGYDVKEISGKPAGKAIGTNPMVEGEKLRRMLCDICDVSYHTTNENLLKKLAEKF